jgi:hypothetical protein
MGMKGQRVKHAKQWSVEIVSVYLSFQNNKINVTVSNKFYDNFEYISIMNLQSIA